MPIDTTVAGANADSYLSVADANALAAADLGPEASGWLATADVSRKEAALKRATREIDGSLRSGWARYAAGQALLFPRAIDRSGTPAVPFIPTSIKRATYEQATFVLRNARTLDDAASRRSQGMQSGSEPDVAWSEAPGPAIVISPQAELYLEGFRRAGGSRGIRSVRMASAYVS